MTDDEPQINETDVKIIPERDNQIVEKSDQKKKMVLTIEYFKNCQSCEENFNGDSNLPYSLTCGHFFCKKCIITQFTNQENQIICPEDQTIIDNFEKLTLLDNLLPKEIIKEKKDPKVTFCKNHPDQNLSHFIENSNEIVCVYCAISKLRSLPNLEIKELKDKNNELLNELNNIHGDTKNSIKKLESFFENFENSKSKNETEINTVFNEIIRNVQEKKDEILESLNNLYNANTTKCCEALETLKAKSEKVNSLISKLNEGNDFESNFNEYFVVLEDFNNSKRNFNLVLNEFKFTHEDTIKLARSINSFGELKMKPNQISFMKLITDSECIDKDEINCVKNINVPKKGNHYGEESHLSITLNKNLTKSTEKEHQNDEFNLQKLRKELLLRNEYDAGSNRPNNMTSNYMFDRDDKRANKLGYFKNQNYDEIFRNKKNYPDNYRVSDDHGIKNDR